MKLKKVPKPMIKFKSLEKELYCTTTNVIYKWRDPEVLNSGAIVLNKQLTMETRWATARYCGPDSIITPGDDMLLSARPVSFTIVNGAETLHNTSDKSTLAFKHQGELFATAGTILYKWIEEPEEEVSIGGIILIKKVTTKESEPRWATVIAAGPDSGVEKGNKVLLAYKMDAYNINIDGDKVHNAGKEEVICFTE